MKEFSPLHEPLLIERSQRGKRAYSLPDLDVPSLPIPKEWQTSPSTNLPELSEPEVVRHFTRLSSWNYCIDTNFYPLGSCTMKYNPKINERAIQYPGFKNLHPWTPAALSQGALSLMYELQEFLREISGMDAVTLQPAAGAQGEYVGIRMIKAALEKRGEKRTHIIIPDTAHGTNPASSAMCGFEVITVKHRNGIIPAAAVEEVMSERVAGLLLTNPNTLGLFESEISQIAEIVHRRGGFLYCDGANLNAILGKVKLADLGVDVMQFNLHKTFSTPHGGGGPGSGPVGVKSHLEAYLPVPVIRKGEEGFIVDSKRPLSIGKVKSFYGHFGMAVRAYAYILSLGAEGLKEVSESAVLNANYLRQALRSDFYIPYGKEGCMHECILSDKLQERHGVSTLDMAKRLLDFGIHPPTIYFPLVVSGALMIEPTDTESKQTLDEFIAIMREIAKEAREEDKAIFKNAPQTTKVRRVDEVSAARHPLLTWQALLQGTATSPSEGARLRDSLSTE